MLGNLRHDAARYAGLGGWLSHPGFWIIAVYRMGTWAHSLRNPLLRIPMWIFYRIARLPLRVFNVDVWAGARGARIGAGLCLIHPSNIIIGRGVEIGDNCLIFNDVTLGTGPTLGVPKVGNNVDIYVGARLLGGLTVGDGCMVGANCVVTKDVPPGSVVVAAPSRVLPRSLAPFARGADQVARAGEQSSPSGTPP